MQLNVIFSATTVLALSLVSVAESAPCPEREHEFAVDIGIFKSWERNLVPGSRLPLQEQDVRYLRVRIEPLVDDAHDWTVRIRDGQGRPLQSIHSSHADGKAFWTDRYYTNKVELFVEHERDAPPAKTVFYQAVGMGADTPFYSIKDSNGQPDWSDVYDPTDGAGGPVEEFWKRRSEPVGMFVVSAGNNLDGVAVWSCTGILVSVEPELLFLTNDHCGGAGESRWAHDICEGNGFVDFSWDGDSTSRQYPCASMVHRSSEDDLALLRLGKITNDAPPTPAVFASNSSIGDNLTIVHHPALQTKKISRGCTKRKLSGQDAGRLFAHTCDTEAGSSGAPAFNDAGEVVGIHHTGHETFDDTCDGLNKAAGLSSVREFLVEAGISLD
ncbi:serine protease [Ruegeria sp. HKCCA4812]|uniref:trypsin-like serine peptidase n=1 Tax=Ruegeria sp. HKCCA4812 TaxID=2682993 RepID=UPI001488EB37|nr:serine protease [Ruegeria sp. HKCCA4812]